MTFIMERWTNYPGMHIYHYSPYEPAAIKRLMSRHALHEGNVASTRARLIVEGANAPLSSVADEALEALLLAPQLRAFENASQ